MPRCDVAYLPHGGAHGYGPSRPVGIFEGEWAPTSFALVLALSQYRKSEGTLSLESTAQRSPRCDGAVAVAALVTPSRAGS